MPTWLAGAAVTIVPSLRETFGLVAAESLSAGTPVIAYAVGNLPDLIGDAGILVRPGHGPAGLWNAAQALLADPVRYAATCGAAYYRSRDYRPTTVADAFLKAVW
jgi:iron(II)-dependent oxidoreductase